MTLDELKAKSVVVYRKDFGPRVRASVLQFRLDLGDGSVWRGQFLALLIEDTEAGRWVCLRLRTVRKLFAWLLELAFVPRARHLTEDEKARMDRRARS